MFASTRQTLLKPNSVMAQCQSRSVYIPPGGKSILTRRLPRKLRVGETRPPIYYKFECKVELSDGSTVTRRSQFPKTEWRYLSDARANPRWNPTRTNLKAVESEVGGRMAKFQKKYGMGVSSEPTSSQEPAPETAPETASEAKKEDVPAEDQSGILSDDFEDLMGENFVPVQAGGKVAQRKKKSKK